MKDRNTIIESGMLEHYFLGTLPEEQVSTLEKMLKEDSILAEKFSEIEEAFENIAFENAVQAPIFVKENLLTAIQDDPKVKTLPKEEASETKRIQPKLFMWIAAGIAAIFMVSSLWMFTEWNSSSTNLNVVQETVETQQERIAALEAELETAELLVKVIKDPSTQQYALKTNKRLPNGEAVAYINHERKYAVVNPQKLPELLEDKTYQMWADVQGEMINMGVIDKKKEVIVLQYVPEATSLNITIEPSGGSDHATVEQLVANVYL